MTARLLTQRLFNAYLAKLLSLLYVRRDLETRLKSLLWDLLRLNKKEYFCSGEDARVSCTVIDLDKPCFSLVEDDKLEYILFLECSSQIKLKDSWIVFKIKFFLLQAFAFVFWT